VGAYIVRRLLLMVVTLVGMSILIFVMLRLVPGNITDIIFDSAGFVNPAQKKKIERELGLDQPIAVQYVKWIGGLMKGDLGYAYVSEKPAIDEILPRIPVTAKLAALALIFSVLFGVPLGVLSAVRQNTALDYVLRVVSLTGLSLPSFWLGLLILMAFVHWFGWIPIYKSTPESPWRELALLSIPAAAVGFRASALIMRLTRSSMLEVLSSEYIKLARLKGLPQRLIIAKHAFKNALIPVLTLAGINLVIMVNVAIVVETVFAWPGIGRLLYEGITFRDFPIVQGVVLLGGVMIVVVNLFVDILYAIIDPRIRLES
jgi:peptide/nickel transport system permease protein